MTPEQAAMLKDVWEQLRGPGGNGWPQLGKNADGKDLTLVDGAALLIGAIQSLIATTQAQNMAVTALIAKIEAK